MKKQENPVLFAAHMDTVQPGRGRRAVVTPDGRITSDGTTVLGADDGAAIACITEAIRELEEEKVPHREIELLFTTAEEAYTVGASAADLAKIRAKEAYIADDSDVIGAYSVHEPTLISFRIEVTGRAAHAGFEPEKGISSILAASRAIAAAEQGRIDPETTLNFGLIRGGTATNAVPEKTVVEGEIRSTVHQRALDLYEQTAELFSKEAVAIGGFARAESTVHLIAYHVPEDSKALGNYKRVLAGLGIPLHPYPSFGGSDVNVLRRKGIDGLCIGNSMYRAHTTEEYAVIDEMTRLVEIFKGLATL